MSEEVEDFLEQLNERLGDERFTWAAKTLQGIHDTVQRTKCVTPNQKQALINITERVEGTASRKVWDRRYEGYNEQRRKSGY